MYFGAHVSASGGIHMAAQRAADMDADAVQMFIQSPRAWRPVTHKPENVERFREICAQHGIRAGVAHAIYLINAASDDPEIYRKSVDALVNTMQVAEQLGLEAVVFHAGSHKAAGLDSCMDRLVTAVERTLERSKTVWLLLENSAGQGGTIGRDTDELFQVIERVGRHPRLGVCLDTCHWFVSGIDITDRAVLDRELDELDSAIGLDRLRCLHINDSKTKIGSNRDRHANIGEGEIADGLSTFLDHPRLQGLPALLEVPGVGDGPTADELRKVRALHTGGRA